VRGRVSRLGVALLAVLAGSSSSGCITAAAVCDLAIPVPAARVTVNESWRGQPLHWWADFGRDPHDIGHFPTRVWSKGEGELELPKGFRMPQATAERGSFYGPPNDLSRAQIPETSPCVYFIGAEPGEPGQVLYYDRDGKVIDEAEVPSELSIASGERWGWLALSPVMDVLLTGIVVVGTPVAGVVYLVGLVLH